MIVMLLLKMGEKSLALFLISLARFAYCKVDKVSCAFFLELETHARKTVLLFPPSASYQGTVGYDEARGVSNL